MDAFAIFSIICFVVYLQASIYVFWRNPFINVYHLFSLMTLLFAIWSLAYIFSYMGEAGRSLFPLPIVTISGLALIPAFYIRLWMSLLHVPKKKNYRNLSFFVVLAMGIIFLWGAIASDWANVVYHDSSLLNNTMALFLLKLVLLLVNTYLFVYLQFWVFKPDQVSQDVINQVDLLSFVCDENLMIIDANPFACRLLGQAHPDLKGKPLTEFVSDGEELMIHFETAIKDGYSGPFDTFLTGVSENHIPVSLRCHGLVDFYGDIQGVAITGEDKIYETSLLEGIKHAEHTERRLKTATHKLQLIIDNYSEELAGIQKNLFSHYGGGSQELIKAEFEERETLIEEIHNRVISNMKLIILLIQSHNKSFFSTLLKKNLAELSRRIRSMLLVHEFLYFSINYSEVDFKGFLYNLVNELKTHHYCGKSVGISFEVSDNYLNVHMAIPLALVVNELLVNSFSHAFPTSDEHAMIHIIYQNEAGHIQMTIKDNGVGIPDRFITGDYQSAGMVLVETLVKDQMGASLDISNSNGTMVVITLPATGHYG